MQEPPSARLSLPRRKERDASTGHFTSFGGRLLSIGSLVLLGLVAVGVGAKPAAACDITTQHCWAIVRFDSQNNYTAGTVHIQATQLSGSSTNFSTAELWVCDPYAQASCWSWVETGWHNGHRFMQSASSLAWFWAESWDTVSGPDCPYANPEYEEHYPSGHPISLGETHTAKIAYDGGNTFKWGVYLDGTKLNSSRACHSWYTVLMENGGETTYNSGVVTADASALQKRASDNQTWSYDWTGATLSLVPSSSNPLNIYWINTYKEDFVYPT